MKKISSSKNKRAKKKTTGSGVASVAQNINNTNNSASEEATTITEAKQLDSNAATTAIVPPRISILTFLRQVRAEMFRVSWPTRNETIVTTIMVFVMVTIAALFFLLADQVLSFAVAWVLGAR